MKHLLPALILCCATLSAHSQSSEKEIIHSFIDTLTSTAMHGRGYVQDGRSIAARYIQSQFKTFNLKPVPGASSMVQRYSFPVNIFPGKMELAVNMKRLLAGDDYIIDASSASFFGNDLATEIVDMSKLTELEFLKRTLSSFDRHHAYVLQNMDTFCKVLQARQEEFVKYLPGGCYIVPQKEKLTWTVDQEEKPATVFYVKASSLPAVINSVSAAVVARQIPHTQNENIIACVPGEIKDTFVAFSAHYDHLGMMGDSVYFPGASDNASGTAMLLYLASYFAGRPQRYSMLFIAFSGEEAGLLGSAYYVNNPVVPLAQIKFLTNIDIMGDATDGVTVVNATEYTPEFAMLNRINDNHKFTPIIKSRGKAANSDHYNFSEKGVHAFFMYSNGGKGFYHDIFDVAKEVTLYNVDGVAKLLIAFAEDLNK